MFLAGVREDLDMPSCDGRQGFVQEDLLQGLSKQRWRQSKSIGPMIKLDFDDSTDLTASRISIIGDLRGGSTGMQKSWRSKRRRPTARDAVEEGRRRACCRVPQPLLPN